MLQVEVTIQGVSPLLMNSFHAEAQAAVESGRKTVGRKETTPREQAERRAYRDPDSGHLYIPGRAVYSCLINAGRHIQIGRAKLSTRDSSQLPGALSLVDLTVGLFDPKTGKRIKEFEVDSQRVVNPSTRGAQVCHRPRIDAWRATFTLHFLDDTVISEETARTLVDIAGRRVGLLDFRPERKGLYGRFGIVGWTRSDVDEAAVFGFNT